MKISAWPVDLEIVFFDVRNTDSVTKKKTNEITYIGVLYVENNYKTPPVFIVGSPCR